MDAAARELREEVGLMLSAGALQPLIVLNDPGRDLRSGHTAAHVFWAEVGSGALEIAFPASDAAAVHVAHLDQIDLTNLTFDHAKAIVALKEVLT